MRVGRYVSTVVVRLFFTNGAFAPLWKSAEGLIIRFAPVMVIDEGNRLGVMTVDSACRAAGQGLRPR